MSAANRWFVIRSEKEHGPYSEAQLRQMAASGQLRPSDKVRREDQQTAWQASAIKGLFSGEPKPSVPPITVVPETRIPKIEPNKYIAIILSVAGGVTLFLCCGCVGLISIVGKQTGEQTRSHAEVRTDDQSPSPAELLTADFYPYKKGTVQLTTGTLYISDGVKTQWRKEYTHKGDGVVIVRWVTHFRGSNELPLPSATQILHRENNGFIEIGEKSDLGNAISWRPIIKIGAEAGDVWERETSPGVTERYKVARFGKEEVALKPVGPKEKLSVATIEIKITTDVTGGKSMEMGEEVKLARGVGPISRDSWRIEDGDRKQNWSEKISSTKHN